jgi:hypothetical protein
MIWRLRNFYLSGANNVFNTEPGSEPNTQDYKSKETVSYEDDESEDIMRDSKLTTN